MPDSSSLTSAIFNLLLPTKIYIAVHIKYKENIDTCQHTIEKARPTKPGAHDPGQSAGH